MAMFNVICLDTGEPERSEETQEPLVFNDGQTASAVAKALTQARGVKYQPRRVLDAGWKEREQKRLEDGTYARLPWDDGMPDGDPDCQIYDWDAPNEWRCFNDDGDIRPDSIDRYSWEGRAYHYPPIKGYATSWHYSAMTDETRHHYAHVSIKNPGNIAFTSSAEKGAADIQTTMKPGRYLTQFYGHQLTPEQIRDEANRFIAKYGKVSLKFAKTPDEFERVYVNGPRSCMSHTADKFQSSMHPVRVYGAGDIECAYLSDEDGAITARALCWPEQKLYGRVYGDEKIETLLQAEGYSYAEEALVGARMLKVRDEKSGGLVVPYVDHVFSAKDAGDFLVIECGGEINCEVANGLTNQGRYCEHCETYQEQDGFAHVRGIGDHWCGECVSNHTFFCEYYAEHFHDAEPCHDVVVRVASYGPVTRTWSQRACDNYAWWNEAEDSYYSDAIPQPDTDDADEREEAASSPPVSNCVQTVHNGELWAVGDVFHVLNRNNNTGAERGRYCVETIIYEHDGGHRVRLEGRLMEGPYQGCCQSVDPADAVRVSA